jgi:hypothetical protein
MGSEKVPIEEAVRRLIQVDATNASKINKLEGQIDEMLKASTEFREQNTNSTRVELQTMSERIESIQSLTAPYHDEATNKYEQITQQLNRVYAEMNINMNCILNKLNQITGSVVITPTQMQNNEQVEEYGTEQNRTGKSSTSTTDTIPGHTLTATTHATPSIPGHTFQTAPYLEEPEAKYEATTPSVFPLNGVKHWIIVPPSSAAPAFHGKHSDSPTQFLIRIQEYAESGHAWNRPTLLNGISQFLRESALEWYCQLRMSHRRPQTWAEFTDLFLAQFNSPVRKARQEQEWHECKQKENETINEFLVRLRTLLREQKPKETEADLVKHLFCRMRNDLLNMIGVSRNASLDEIIAEVQQIEEILYRRAKSQRLLNQLKQPSLSDTGTLPNKHYNGDHSRKTIPGLSSEYSLNDYPREQNDYEVNVATPSCYLNNRIQTAVDPNTSQQLNSYGCYSCGEYGHLARNCPIQYENYRQQRSKPNQKTTEEPWTNGPVALLCKQFRSIVGPNIFT